MKDSQLLEKENGVERELMSEEEFKDYLENNPHGLHLVTYQAVGKFKSVRRAIRKGLVSPTGFIAPARPFNNKKNSCKRGKHSRPMNEEKKRIYASIKEYRRRHADDGGL
jgi:hypothetical protein